jgi:hypothetical protein
VQRRWTSLGPHSFGVKTRHFCFGSIPSSQVCAINGGQERVCKGNFLGEGVFLTAHTAVWFLLCLSFNIDAHKKGRRSSSEEALLLPGGRENNFEAEAILPELVIPGRAEVEESVLLFLGRVCVCFLCGVYNQ